jgi:hypothetical protein
MALAYGAEGTAGGLAIVGEFVALGIGVAVEDSAEGGDGEGLGHSGAHGGAQVRDGGLVGEALLEFRGVHIGVVLRGAKAGETGDCEALEFGVEEVEEEAGTLFGSEVVEEVARKIIGGYIEWAIVIEGRGGRRGRGRRAGAAATGLGCEGGGHGEMANGK